MRTSGIYFDYGGHEFKQFFAGDNWVSAAISYPDESRFPDALEFGETRGQHWVKLPRATIEDRRRLTVRATWRGAPVTVDAHVTDTEVVLGYVGPAQRATNFGMDGDQYMGWTVIAPADEVESLSIDIRRFERIPEPMSILIEGTKVFEDEQSIAYAFDWPGAERSGEVRITKTEVEAGLSTAGSDLDPAAARILMKACKEARATGVWPGKVFYAS